MTYHRFSRTCRVQYDRGGYILLTTLLIIAMVCMLTVGLARYSMNVAGAANSSRRDLQDKWGAVSCQRFALANQAELLNLRVWDSETENWVLQPIPRTDASFELGNLKFNVRLSDESSKLNLNSVLKESGRQQAIKLARKFGASDSMRVNLRPLKDRSRRGPVEDALESWGQVFESASGGQFWPRELMLTTQNLTCWSNRLNYRTAEESVIEETCKPVVGRILTQKLISIFDSDEASNWEQSITAAGAKESQVQQLRKILSPTSRSQSVWVELAQPDRSRAWFAVREEVAGTVYRIHSFSW